MTEIVEKPTDTIPQIPSQETTLPAKDMMRVARNIHLAWSDDQRFKDSYPVVKAQISEVLRGTISGDITVQEAEEILTALQLEQQMASEKDSITGAYSRRAGEILLELAIINSRRTGKPVTVAMLDLDKFHDVNDAIEHEGGDAVLKATAEHVQSNLRRESDFLVRWGGEEFVLIMQGADEEWVRKMMDTVRVETPAIVNEAISSQDYHLDENVTFSTGIASILVEKTDERKPDEIRTEIVNLADERLGLAKNNGRNQIVGSREAAILQK
jgi:diguanylate cyclase (GGDEF)-like protein